MLDLCICQVRAMRSLPNPDANTIATHWEVQNLMTDSRGAREKYIKHWVWQDRLYKSEKSSAVK